MPYLVKYTVHSNISKNPKKFLEIPNKNKYLFCYSNSKQKISPICNVLETWRVSILTLPGSEVNNFIVVYHYFFRISCNAFLNRVRIAN